MKFKRILALLFIATLPSSCITINIGGPSTSNDSTDSTDSNSESTNTNSGTSVSNTGSSQDSTNTDTSTTTTTSSSEDKESKETTADAVAKASLMTLEELENASKKEWEEKPNGTFKVLGVTSVLKTVMKEIAANYDWITYTADKFDNEPIEGDNCFVKNDYKSQALLAAIAEAETKYVADYTLVLDCRSFATYLEEGILHNYVPSDAAAFGLKEEDQEPLRGIWWNKVFWTNTNYENVGGKPINNVWQFAGTSADPQHIDQVSFQSPQGETINLSFLVEAMAPANEARLKDAYRVYYGHPWFKSSKYATIGEQWVEEFVRNVKIWHSSDGTAMKETQLKNAWAQPVVYFGYFFKMKDAAGKKYTVDLDGDGVVGETEIDLTLTCGGTEYHYTSEVDVNAMTTVKWDYEIEGFNGFMHSMDSEVLENAEYPYTACLFARTLLQESTFLATTKNPNTPTATGEAGNQYGYYYPGTESATFPYAKGDWTKAKHLEKELVEDYTYLKDVKASTVNKILSIVAEQTNIL